MCCFRVPWSPLALLLPLSAKVAKPGTRVLNETAILAPFWRLGYAVLGDAVRCDRAAAADYSAGGARFAVSSEGEMPNIDRNVRDMWAASENSAAWAASVSEAPAAMVETALCKRSHSR